jgi:hypothetical protein
MIKRRKALTQSKGSSRIDRIGQNGNDGLHYPKSVFHDQWDFIQAAGIETGTRASEILAEKLVNEEAREFYTDPLFTQYGNVNKIKEACDLIYTACQYLNSTVGPDVAQLCYSAVHQNNMLKVQGKTEKRADGKVLKNNVPKLDLTEIINASK